MPGAQGLKVGEYRAATATPNKNAKRREARKKAAAATKTEAPEGEADDTQNCDGNEANGLRVASSEPKSAADSEVDQEKEARKLSKKLRQARDLKEKKDKGDSLLPEQFEKVIKINELIRQLDALGFDAEGEKKKEV